MKDWKRVKLGGILTESRIVSEKPDANKRLTVRLHTQGIEKRPFTKGKKGATKYFVRSAGQFIYGRQNLHKGAFGIIPEEFDGYESSADIPAFDVDESCLPEWIYYFFKKGNFYLKLESIAKGVGSKRINPSQIFSLDILIPSIEEQKKLLAKVNNFTKKYEQADNEFKKQIEYIKQLKQSISSDAVTGKLSEKWRENHLNKSHARELLKQINKSFQVKQENIRLNKNEEPFIIPDSWVWCNLSQVVIDKPKNGYSPKGVNYVTQTKSLKLSATTKGIFDETQIKYIEEEIPKDSHLWLKNGDILIQRSNSLEYVGISAIYKGADDEFIYPDLMVKIQVVLNMQEYIHICLNSQYARNYFRSNASGASTSMPKINQAIIQETPIPLPPIEEQNKIISEVNRLNSICEKLEIEANNNILNAKMILDSSLSEILGEDINTFQSVEKVKKNIQKKRIIKFDSKTTLMDLVELLQEHGKLHAEDLWKMSKSPDDIDAFYAELKHQIENEKSIKEVENEKGYLELA